MKTIRVLIPLFTFSLLCAESPFHEAPSPDREVSASVSNSPITNSSITNSPIIESSSEVSSEDEEPLADFFPAQRNAIVQQQFLAVMTSPGSDPYNEDTSAARVCNVCANEYVHGCRQVVDYVLPENTREARLCVEGACTGASFAIIFLTLMS